MKSRTVFWSLVLASMAAAVYLGFSGGHSEEARRRVEPGSSAAMGLISEGEDVHLAEHAAVTGRTVFEFSATWCGGCRRLAPSLEEAVRESGDTTLRVIDIGSWESPVAQRYRIRSVPHLVLFEDGEVVAAGTADVLDQLER